MSAAIEIRNVSKRYRARRGPGVLAVDDVSFELEPGRSLGIIGDNGSGKTTTLRMIARLTTPTSGSVRTRGRVAAITSVMAGLHPELSGRENVLLYARILGVERQAIASRFDEIVELAEIGEAIDQPIKRYSLGMQLRLGFAVSLCVEPDVLLIDEAITVGDVGFQYRCTQRLREMREQGRTLVLVSHQMITVESLCERSITLDRGRLVDEGPSAEVVDRYLRRAHARLHTELPHGPFRGERLDLEDVDVRCGDGAAGDVVTSGEPFTLRLAYDAACRLDGTRWSVGLFDDRYGMFVLVTMLADGEALDLEPGPGVVECRFDGLPLRPRTYGVWASVHERSGGHEIVAWQPVNRMLVEDKDRPADAELMRPYDTPLQTSYRWVVASSD